MSYDNSESLVELESRLDYANAETAKEILLTARRLLTLDGKLTLTGCDVVLAARAYLAEKITTQEFIHDMSGRLAACEMWERINQLASYGFEVVEKRLEGYTYYLGAKRNG